jgi:hypothetical protein
VVLLVMKVLLAPLLLAACSFAAWRWGAAVGGWLLGLPLISGPVSLLLFLEHGPGFAESAAAGTLLGLLATGAFCALYARVAPRARWWLALPLAYAVCLAVALGLTLVRLPVAWVAVLVVAGLSALSMTARRPALPASPPKPATGALIAKMAVASVAVMTVTTAAGVLGPHLAGLLAPLPVLLALVAASSHRRDGHEAAQALLRGALAGSWGGAAFFVVVALTPAAASPFAAYAFAAATALLGAWLAMRLQAKELGIARAREGWRRVGAAIRLERHLSRVRLPRPAFLWMMRG